MKKISTALVILLVLAVLGSCNFILGPDKPAAADNEEGGTGNLVISIGGGGAERAILTGSGNPLPDDVLDALRYDLTLTGPGGSSLSTDLSPGQNLSMTVIVGGWRIDARAYQDDILAGTGSLNFTVSSGVNSIRVPMNVNGGYFDITVDISTGHGTVEVDRDAAFPETELTLTVMPDSGYILKPGTLKYHYGGSGHDPAGIGLIYTFTMPPEDVTVSAEFEALPPDMYSITVDGPISHGTVNPDLTSAPAGTPVTLTVTPASEYALRAGTLKYNDGITDNVITSGPPYTFTMPASHVTVSAEFELIMYSITVDSPVSNGTLTPSAASAVAGTTVTLTVTPDADSVLQAVTYDDGTSHPISGPPYTFSMPSAAVTVSAQFSQVVRYVRAGGSGLNNGTSWGNASGDLQKMMDELGEITIPGYTGPYIVKAGAGTYKPQYKPTPDYTTDYTTAANDRDSAFLLRPGVQVWGGYPDSGGEDSSRNIAANITTLSGDFSGDDTGSGATLGGNTENAYHVVKAVNIPAASGTVLDGLTITGGNAEKSGDSFGGGMHNHNSSPVLNGVIITRNAADFRGGGIYNTFYSSPVLNNMLISGNLARGGSGSEGGGGGIYSDTSSPALNNVEISGNAATNNGGGMGSLRSTSTLTNVTISGNTASGSGGGIYMYADGGLAPPVLKMIGGTVSGNTAASGGGGIFNWNANLALINVTIAGNDGGSGGGGIYNLGSSGAPGPVLINMLISGNTATDGGGVFNTNSSPPKLINVTVAGNAATGKGGGMYNTGSGSAPKIYNSIIWGNTATDSSALNVFNTNSGAPIFAYSIVQGSGNPWAFDPAFDGGNNKDGDPLFSTLDPTAPTTGGNYSLQNTSPASPAVDAGLDTDYPDDADNTIFVSSGFSTTEEKAAVNAALGKDLAGNTRKQGTAIDMGAYERE